jgi:outer membrane immunogenic protein
MKTALLGLAALVVSGGAALAADPTWPSAQTSHDWTGWYVGGFAGTQSGVLTQDLDGFDLFDGIDAGVQLLYQKQLPNNWVVSPFVSAPFPQVDSSPGLKMSLNWALFGGARLGYAQGRWLPYGFLAAAVGNVSAEGGGTNTHFGFALGAGFDYALNDRWSAGARYAHTAMGARHYSGYDTSAGWNGDSFAATLTYKFH